VHLRSASGGTAAAGSKLLALVAVAAVVTIWGLSGIAIKLTSTTGRDWAIFLFLALLPGTLGHLLMNWAHRHASAFVMSVMLLATPVIASLGAAALLDEALRAIQIAGGMIVLIAIGVIVRSTRAGAGEQLAESAAATDAP